MLESFKSKSKQYGLLPHIVVILLISSVSDISIQLVSIIVDKFDNFLLFIWNSVGNLIGVDIAAYRRELTFCSLIFAMVWSNYDKIEQLRLTKPDSNLMQWLNFFAMITIQGLLSNKNPSLSLFTLYFAWLNIFICIFLMYTIYINDEFILLLKLILILISLIFISKSLVYLNINSENFVGVDYMLAPIIVFTSLFVLVVKVSDRHEFIYIISIYYVFILINFINSKLPLFSRFSEAQK